MISNKHKNILLLTLLLIAAHGIEENLTGFYARDFFIQYPSSLFNSIPQTFYWSFHIMWWLLVLIAFFLIIGGKKAILVVLTVFGIVYFFEIHHIFKGLLNSEYYPGMATGILYPILGIFYWKELLKEWRLR